MLPTKNGAYHPVIGLMPSPLEEVPEEINWYYEKWATPYMAAIARVVFRRKPAVTLTPQPGPGEGLGWRIPESLVGGVPLPMEEIPMPGAGTWKETICKICSSELRYYYNPSLGPEYNIPAKCPVCGDDLAVRSVRGEVQIIESGQERITALGAEGEWFKEKRGLVIVVVSIVALVLLLFFFKKRKA